MFQGLSAAQVAAEREKYGLNQLEEATTLSPLRILLQQVKKNFMVYLLFFAMLLSFSPWVDKAVTGYALLVVILIVVLTGFIQEFRAEKAIQSLKKMVMPKSVVIRDGKEREIDSREIVPGDIVVIRSGERVPADAVVLQEQEIRVSEAMLTGESDPVPKDPLKKFSDHDAPDAMRVFMGTFVVQGRCVARITDTGMRTRFGKIAKLISSAQKEHPLQKKINNLAKYMAIFAILAAVLTGLVMLFQGAPVDEEVAIGIIVVVIALMVASIPEGMPVVLIMTLAAGANRMAKRNAIVNRMSVIEALGETTVICTDKTGTLTKAEMTVRRIWANNTFYDVDGVGYSHEGAIVKDGKQVKVSGALAPLLDCAVLCNDAHIEYVKNEGAYETIGTPTEIALLMMSAKGGVYQSDEYGERWEEIPFNSQRKMMSVVYRKDRKEMMYAKGAPEFLLNVCTKIRIGNTTRKLLKKDREAIVKVLHSFAEKSYRTLGLAYKIADPKKKDVEEDLVFIGLVALEDPPRPEVFGALATCREAGIEVKMLTGDNFATAKAIAREIGLVGEAVEGSSLDGISDSEFDRIIKDTTIFARVRPDHKIRIVESLKRNGHIVTMTGDGVNDAPALKEAHIGVAMGKNGTDVTRDVADLTLKDDNFASIVDAVSEGRTIFTNIQRFVAYQISVNISQLFVISISILLGLPLPLIAMQILFINMLSDEIIALTLGFHPKADGVMNSPPRKSSHLFSWALLLLIITTGVVMTIAGIAVFAYVLFVLGEPEAVARSALLVTMVLFGITNAFNFYSFKNPVSLSTLFGNKYILYAAMAAIMFTVLILYVPALRSVFETSPIALSYWGLAAAIAVGYVFVVDIIKLLVKRFGTVWD